VPTPRYVAIANPAGKRWQMYAPELEAFWAERGVRPEVEVVPWSAVVPRDGELDDLPAFDRPALVRLESPGRDWDVARLLLQAGEREDGGDDQWAALPCEKGRFMNRQGRSGGQLLGAGPFSVPHGPGQISSIRFCILDEVGGAGRGQHRPLHGGAGSPSRGLGARLPGPGDRRPQGSLYRRRSGTAALSLKACAVPGSGLNLMGLVVGSQDEQTTSAGRHAS
jgi:hypothetical protein